MGPRIKQIVAQVGPTLDTGRPAYAYDYEAVDALAPFVPRMAFYGFGNYRPAPGTPPPAEPREIPPSMPGLWERAANDDRPQNPRLFMIPNTPEVFIGDGDPVINWHPDLRKDYEYECELLGVVGRPMRRVAVDQVQNYMFGYANTNDISDRQARRPDPVGQDMLVQKGWDSMKPVGPFIGLQEFVDPLNMSLQDDRRRHARAGLEHEPGVAQHVRVRVLPLAHAHRAGRHRHRTRHASRITWRPWAAPDSWRRSGLFVRGAWHVDEYLDRRTSAHDRLAIVDADQVQSVPS